MPRTILLVDDDALMRRSLAFHLEQAGYQVHTAANAEDAVNMVRRAPPDLVVLDIGLPGMDGLEALREIKAQHNLPVIFLTGRRRELDEVVGGDLEIDPQAHTVTCAGRTVNLSPREFDLLLLLASQPEKVFSTEDLLAQVWGAEFVGQPQVVYVHIRWLREKLEADPGRPVRILTVRGVGYKLLPQ